MLCNFETVFGVLCRGMRTFGYGYITLRGNTYILSTIINFSFMRTMKSFMNV
jgi:hypothetical protein